MGEARLRGDESPANQRLTVPEAAAELGITEAAVRGRIKRGTLRSYRESGKVYVLLEGDASTTNRDAPTDAPTDESELIAVLREQLAEEREARRRADTIIAQLTQANATLAARIPELEAPTVPREPPESAEPRLDRTSDTAEPRSAPEEPQEPTSQPQEEPRTWWRRMFGG
jgi:hypothetical protein